jgi:hypothetical protein
MNHSDMAIAILQKTNDGDDLKPSDLALLEAAVNGRLTTRGVELFEAMHQEVKNETYSSWQTSTFIAPHLTKAPDGTVFWKGIAVEHYSYPATRREEEARQASELARRCRQLEANGIPVNSRTVLSEDCYTAPANSPWLELLGKYYTFMQKGEQTIGLFYVDLPKVGPGGIAARFTTISGSASRASLHRRTNAPPR